MLKFIRDNIRWLAVGFLLLLSSSFGQTFFVALSVSEIQNGLGLTSGQFGSIYMMVTLASAAALAQISFIIDRFPLWQVVAASLPMLATGAIIISISSSLYSTILGLFLLRLFGQGMALQCAFTAMGRWFDAHRGRATSLAALGLNAGEALLPISFVVIASGFGWRTAWLCMAVLLVLVILPVVVLLAKRERVPAAATRQEASPSANGWSRKETIRDPFFYYLLLGVLPPAVISSSVFFHHGTLFVQRGWGDGLFAQSFTIYAIVMVITLLVAGTVVDRLKALKLIPIHLLPLALGCIVLARLTPEWVMFLFMALYALTDGFSLTMFGSLWPEVYGTKNLGSIRGVLTAILAFATAIGPGVAGLLIDLGVGVDVQLMAMGVYCLIMLPIQIWVSKKVEKRLLLERIAKTT